MASAELVFEQLDLALESTPGTPVTPPTHRLLMGGTMDPVMGYYDDETDIGSLAGLNRSELLQTSVTLSPEGALDVYTLPVLLNMGFAIVTSPSTPTNGVLTRLWTFPRLTTADTLKAATWYWGDPNAKMYQSAFGRLQRIGWGADGTGTDGATQSFDAIGQTITPLGSVPTLPALGQAPLLAGLKMQLWIDTSSTWGTTEVTGRVAAMDVDVPLGVEPKYVAVGPAGGLTYTRVGRNKTVPELNITLDKVDETELNLALNATAVKVRARWSGPLIEAVTPNYYSYVQVDMYGRLRHNGWGDVAGTNRAVQLTLRGELNSTMGTDIIAYVQNTKTSL